jgi:hypothetical protein
MVHQASCASDEKEKNLKLVLHMDSYGIQVGMHVLQLSKPRKAFFCNPWEFGGGEASFF